MSIIVSADKNKDIIAHAIDADVRIYEIAYKWCCSEAGTNNVINFEEFKAGADADDIDLKRAVEKAKVGLHIIEKIGDSEIVVSVIVSKVSSGWFNVSVATKREFSRRFYILKVLALGHQCAVPLPAIPAVSPNVSSAVAPMRSAPRLLQLSGGMSLTESLIVELKQVHERRKTQQHLYARAPIVATVSAGVVANGLPQSIVVGLNKMTVAGGDESSSDSSEESEGEKELL